MEDHVEGKWSAKPTEKGFYDKIFGCLSMVAIGDALGMPAHDMTIEEIKKRFGGPINEFRSPFDDSRVHKGMQAGQITDDMGLTLALVNAYIDGRGVVNSQAIGERTAEWVNHATKMGYGKMIGQTTRQAVQAINAGLDPIDVCKKEKNPMIGATNGGAMKISSAGLVHPGDIEGAVKDALTICLPTHGTQTGISGASAIAAGVAEAMRSEATVFSVVKAGLTGAIRGEKLGIQFGRMVPLPSVPERIKCAISIALKASNWEEANQLFSTRIGTGLAAYESVPTAIGIFLACEGDPMACVIAGANVGYDTDTIASMVGALSGTFRGSNGIPKNLVDVVQKVNLFDLDSIARALSQIVAERHGKKN